MIKQCRMFAVAAFVWATILAMAACSTASSAEVRSFESGGEIIRADFYPPDAGRDTHRAIIVLHGAGGMLFDGPEMRRVARRLADDGNSVYLLHYFNRTGSFFFAGDSGMHKNFGLWVATVREAVDWVAREERKRGNRARTVGIYGYSLGGFLALVSASDNPQTGAVVAQAGGVWNKEERRIGHLPPVLLVHGRADARVPFDEYAGPMVKLLQRRRTLFETCFYVGEGHGFSAKAQARVREQTADFFKRRLRR